MGPAVQTVLPVEECYKSPSETCERSKEDYPPGFLKLLEICLISYLPKSGEVMSPEASRGAITEGSQGSSYNSTGSGVIRVIQVLSR
eukprot:s2676_g15.t1